jgi:hypothetical protein
MFMASFFLSAKLPQTMAPPRSPIMTAEVPSSDFQPLLFRMHCSITLLEIHQT